MLRRPTHTRDDREENKKGMFVTFTNTVKEDVLVQYCTVERNANCQQGSLKKRGTGADVNMGSIPNSPPNE
jgi:hypothetical protein